MSKNNQIKKFVNGEVADADEVNAVVESAGNEGGAIPYDPTSHQRDEDGNEAMGSLNYSWGDIFVNEEAFLREIVTVSASEASSVKFKHLRKLVYMKDVVTNTTNSWVGHGGQALRVKLDETGIEPASTSNVQIFTSSGTFTAPADIHEVFVTMIGGGGGGGSTGAGGSSSGGGGGAGGYKINHRFSVTPGSDYTVTVGAGGAGGVFDENSGANGGNTSFDSVTVPGGTGGEGVNANGNGGAGGGMGFDASDSISTEASAGGGQIFKGGNGAKGGSTLGGGGGGSPFGAGANGGSSSGGSNAAANTGSGGGGAGSGGGGGGANGGNGAAGIVIVMY